jgi:hypothetical protein
VLFVGLKLAGIITWSWWWVTVPFWGGLAVGIAIMTVAVLLAALVAGTIAVVEGRRGRR